MSTDERTLAERVDRWYGMFSQNCRSTSATQVEMLAHALLREQQAEIERLTGHNRESDLALISVNAAHDKALMMTDDVRKLPAWPEAPFTNSMSPRYVEDWSDYYQLSADAYRARMEALKKYIKHNHGCTAITWREGAVHCTCGLDALLASCEREGGR